MKVITVLIADDHSIVRAGIRALLEAVGDIHVVGEAENGRQAVLETARLRPDVVLLDLAMPVLNGVEAARQIAQQVPSVKVLILSSYCDDQHVREAFTAGAAGYLLKEAGGDDLLEAVRATRNGDAFFSPPVLNQLLELQKKRPGGDPCGTTRSATLTTRQAEVLQLIAEGYATKQIADVLLIDKKTADKHRQALMDKLNLHKSSVLTRYAVAKGVIESGRIPDCFPGLALRPAESPRRKPEERLPTDGFPNL